MIRVWCECDGCVHWDDGECSYDGVTISDRNITAAGFLPVCQDYEERDEEDE